MKNKLVSIIIPSYNHKQYIEKTIISIMSQDYPYIELIIIDDNSSDGSQELLEELQIKYAFKLILKKKNFGKPSDSLNIGLFSAKGEYIKFLASDDLLSNDNVISKQVLELNSLDESYAGVVGSIYEMKNNKITSIYSISTMLPLSYCTTIAAYGITIQASIFKKRCLIEINGFDNNSLIEDYELSIRLLKKYKLKRTKMFSVIYRIHSTNLSGPQNFEKMLNARKYIYNKFDDLKQYNLFKSAIKEKKLILMIKYISPINIKFLLCNVNYLIKYKYMKFFLKFFKTKYEGIK